MDAMSQNNNSKDAVLNSDSAKQILSNIFDACEQEENRVPIDVLESYSHYRQERHGLQRLVVVLVIIAFALLPLLFITADVRTAWEPDAEPGKPVLRMEAEALLPIDSIRVSMDGLDLDIYQEADGSYLIHPQRNGILDILVTLVNKQYTHHQVEVTTVDQTPPEMIKSVLRGDNLVIYFRDDSGKLNFDSIYAMDRTGKEYKPLSYDEAALTVTFTYPETDVNIFVTDPSGNMLQMVLTLKENEI